MPKFSILIYFSSYSHVAFWLELSGLLLYSHDNISISPSWRRVGKSQSTAQEACFDPTSYSLSHEKVVLLGNLSQSSLNSWATFAVLFWLLMCFNQELVSFLCDCEQHSSLFKVFAMLHPPPHNFYFFLVLKKLYFFLVLKKGFISPSFPCMSLYESVREMRGRKEFSLNVL